MKSVLIPSPLLNLIPLLSPQEQSLFRVQNRTNLDIEKYKNGKVLFLAYIEARSFENISDRYNNFIQQFKQLSYVSRVLQISSLKYYRDIKCLLIGGQADGGIVSDTRFKRIKIDEIIKQLEEICENRRVVKAKIEQGKKNIIQLEIDSPQTSVKKIMQDTQMEPQSEIRLVKNQSKKKIVRKKLDYEVPSQKTPNHLPFQQKIIKGQVNTSMTDMKLKDNRIQISNKNEKIRQTDRKLAVKQEQKKYNPGQLNLLKLIRVEQSRNPNLAMKSERINLKKQQTHVDKQLNTSIRSLNRRPMLSSLQENNLYHHRRSWGAKHETNNKEIKPNPALKKPLSNWSNKQLKVISKPTKRPAKHKSSIMLSICQKIMQCLRGLKPHAQNPKEIICGKQQQREWLVKKKTSSNESLMKNPLSRK